MTHYIAVREKNEDGSIPIIPEDIGLPFMILYGSRAVIRLRKQSPEEALILGTFAECIENLYQGRMRVVEQLPTR
jgi:hypothetical protein